MEIDEQLRRQWRDWAVRNLGGPEARVEIATQAAVSALGQGKSRDEAAVVAREAASAWQTARAPAVAPTPEPHGGCIRGRVAAMQQRQEIAGFRIAQYNWNRYAGQPYTLIWDFRLERNAPDGTPLAPVAVEMVSKGSMWGTSKGFKGSVLNGDEVEVDGRDYQPGRVLRVEQVWNLTSNSIVRERGSAPSRIFAALAAENTERYDVIRGRVVVMQQRQDRPGHTRQIMDWAFRVQQTRSDGSLRPLVEVEMRSDKFEGSIAVGDEIEVDGRDYSSGDVLSVKQVRNLSSNSVVHVR